MKNLVFIPLSIAEVRQLSQLSSEQFSNLVQKAVRKAINEASKKPVYGNIKSDRKRHKKSNRKKHKRFPKPGKIFWWLIQLFFVFVIHSMANNGCMPKLPNPECPVLQYGRASFLEISWF